MSILSSWNGAYVCSRCLRITPKKLLALRRRAVNVNYAARRLSTAIDDSQTQPPRKKPRSKSKQKKDGTDDSEPQHATKKPRQQSWTTTLKNQSLGGAASVLVLRDSETKRKSRTEIQQQDAPSVNTVDDNIFSSLNQDQPEPSQDEVFEHIEAMRPRSQTIPRKEFIECIKALKNSFSTKQLNTFVHHSKPKVTEKAASLDAEHEGNKSALTNVMWKPVLSAAQRQHSTKRNTMAEVVMRVTWGIGVEDEASWNGSVVVKPKNPDLLEMLLVGGNNSILRELSARLQMKIVFHKQAGKIGIYGTKNKCLHAANELNTILKDADALVFHQRPLKSLSKETLKLVGDRCQCVIRIAEPNVVIRGRDRFATSTCARLLISLLPVGLDQVKKTIVPGEPKEAWIVQANQGRSEPLKNMVNEQTWGRLTSQKELHASLPSNIAHSEEAHTKALQEAIELLSVSSSQHQNLREQLSTPSLLSKPNAHVNTSEGGIETTSASTSAPTWRMSPIPFLRAEFGHELHPLPQNQINKKMENPKSSQLSKRSDFASYLSGLIPLSLDHLGDPQTSRQELLSIRLRPSPWMMNKNFFPKGFPMIEMKLSIDQYSRAIVIEDVRAILDRRIASLLQPQDDFDMRLIKENSILLQTPGSNGAVHDFLIKMRGLTTKHNRLFPPAFLKLAIPRNVIDFEALGRQHSDLVKDGKEHVEIDWFAEGIEFEERVTFEFNESDLELSYYRIQGGEIFGSREGISLASTQNSETSTLEIEEEQDVTRLIESFSKEAFDLLRKLNFGVDQQQLIDSQAGRTRLRLDR